MRAPLIAGAAALLAVTTACSSAPAPAEPANTAEPTHAAKPANTAEPVHAVDQAEAARIATQKYGGHSLGVEQDTAQGKPSWEVEIADSGEGRIEVDIAQQTGAILTMEHD